MNNNYKNNVLATYASAGWNDGLTTGPHHAQIARGEVRTYADAEGFEAAARAAYLKAYGKARKVASQALGAGKAYSF